MPDRSHLRSWLSPDGTTHPAGYRHDTWALVRGKTPESLMEQGWHRVQYYGDELWTNNPHGPPNPRQLKALTDLAVEHGMSVVMHDDDEDNRVLWSAKDKMQRKKFAAAPEPTPEPDNIHKAWEVRPDHYAVVFSSPNQQRDRVVSKHPTLSGAFEEKWAHDDARRRTGAPNDWGKHHVFAVYPDRSAKIVGYETDGYHERVGGNFHQHTRLPDFESIYYRPPHDADAAPVSHHRYLDNAAADIAEASVRGSAVRAGNVPTGPGSDVRSFLKSAMDTGDLTPLLALADYFEERGVGYAPAFIRRRVEKAMEDIDRLRWRRHLRTSPQRMQRRSLRRRPVRYARPRLPVAEMHPSLRFTRLGAVLRAYASLGTDDAAVLAHQAVAQPADRPLELMPLHLLRDYVQENPGHPLASRFNWEKLPEKVALDVELGNYLSSLRETGERPNLPRHITGYSPTDNPSRWRTQAYNAMHILGHDWVTEDDVVQSAARLHSKTERETTARFQQ
jgi:hypothetical protein